MVVMEKEKIRKCIKDYLEYYLTKDKWLYKNSDNLYTAINYHLLPGQLSKSTFKSRLYKFDTDIKNKVSFKELQTLF